MRQRTERNERNKIERIYTISEIIIHGVQVENLAQWPNYVPQQNDRCEQEVKKREHERKKEINYEPCVLPKFIQFTRIVCNDDDSHLACVWRAKALHKIGVMSTKNQEHGTERMERVPCVLTISATQKQHVQDYRFASIHHHHGRRQRAKSFRNFEGRFLI